MSIHIINITWRNIPIEIKYNNKWFEPMLKNSGCTFAHIEIKSQDRQRIPITETGYRSHFIPEPEIKAYGGVGKYVLDWLNREAKSKAWKTYKAQSNQLKLDLL